MFYFVIGELKNKFYILKNLTLEERHKNSLALHLASSIQHAKYSTKKAQNIECLTAKYQLRLDEQARLIESAKQVLSIFKIIYSLQFTRTQ